jgi:hypothetical protein
MKPNRRIVLGILAFDGKENPEFGSFAGLAVDFYPPAMIGHDAVDDGQPEPGPLANIFSREERLEYPIPRLGIHAAARIGDPKENEATAGRCWTVIR